MSNHGASGKAGSRRDVLKLAGAAGLTFAVGNVCAARAQSNVMKVFIGSNPAFGNIMMGADKGFFEREGLKVEVTKFASGATAVDAFRAGRGNFVSGGDLPSLRLWQKGGVGLCPQANYGELSVLVAKKSIRKPEDLRGKKLGTLMGSTEEYLAKQYLASGNVDFKDVEFVNLRPAGMVTGLARGDIDAFACFQPFGWRALKADPDAHILTATAPFFREWLVVNTTPEYAKTHEGELVAFLKALDKAGKWISGNVDEATTLIARNLGMDDTATVKQMLRVIDWNIAYTKKFRADMDKLGKFFGVPIDWNKSFHSQALAKLGSSYVE
jgi:ABC-type nitrate/sulfonate/bicarbonate transport system substrate-binding protein